MCAFREKRLAAHEGLGQVEAHFSGQGVEAPAAPGKILTQFPIKCLSTHMGFRQGFGQGLSHRLGEESNSKAINSQGINDQLPKHMRERGRCPCGFAQSKRSGRLRLLLRARDPSIPRPLPGKTRSRPDKSLLKSSHKMRFIL